MNKVKGQTKVVSKKQRKGKWLSCVTLSLQVVAYLLLAAPRPVNAQDWSLTGNSGTNPANNFLGTTDNQPLVIKTNQQEAMRIDAARKIGIGTRNPEAKLHIHYSTADDAVKVTNTDIGKTLRIGVDQVGSWLEPTEQNSSIRLNANPLLVGLFIDGQTGKVGIGGAIAARKPEAKLHIHYSTADDAVKVTNTDIGKTLRIGVDQVGSWLEPTEQNSSIRLNANPFLVGLFIDGQTGNAGIGTRNPAAKLDVAGMTRTSALQITGGSDLAESFEINGAEAIKPGMVVAIDPDRPGDLRVANKAYDRTVAGIVSGANKLNPGLILKQQGTVTDSSVLVSLTGRVYCWLDASHGPIAPGDLLTTSDVPGHAMKVTDHERAQGAIIGKAMTSLEEGRGLVLVLIALQ